MFWAGGDRFDLLRSSRACAYIRLIPREMPRKAPVHTLATECLRCIICNLEKTQYLMNTPCVRVKIRVQARCATMLEKWPWQLVKHGARCNKPQFQFATDGCTEKDWRIYRERCGRICRVREDIQRNIGNTEERGKCPVIEMLPHIIL